MLEIVNEIPYGFHIVVEIENQGRGTGKDSGDQHTFKRQLQILFCNSTTKLVLLQFNEKKFNLYNLIVKKTLHNYFYFKVTKMLVSVHH